MRILIFISLCFPIFLSAKPITKELTEDFFRIYAERKDFNAFMEYYADEVVFEDVLFDTQLNGKDKLADFFDWHRGEFKRQGTNSILELKELVINGNIAIAQGVFYQFMYNDKLMGPWKFMMRLEFNDKGKIISHQDWINYTPKTIKIGQ